MSDMAGGSLVKSSSALDSNVTFDLLDEKDTLTLLQKIHKTALSPEEKNKLRDAIFTFRSSGDTKITDEMAQLFASYNLSINSNTSEQKNVKKNDVTKLAAHQDSHIHRLGRMRPKPKFHRKETEIEIKIKQNIIADKQANTSVNTAEEQMIRKDDISKSNPNLAQAQKLHVDPVPVITNDAQVVDKTKTVSQADLSTKEQISQINTSTSTSTEAKVVPQKVNINTHDSEPLERIKEIKKEINELVGNPVNLIDAHNEIGREYMNALLDAMKKSNGASKQEVTEAMNRLESAYTAVKKVLENDGGLTTKTEVSAQQTTPVSKQPTATQQQVVEPSSEESVTSGVEEEARIPVTNVAQAQKSQVNIPKEQVSGFTSVLQSSASADKGNTVHDNNQVHIQQDSIHNQVTSAPSVDKEIPVTQEQNAQNILRVNLQNAQITSPSVDITNSVTGQNISTAPVHRMMSVAKEKKLEDLLNSEKKKEANVAKEVQQPQNVPTDPLMAPEVTTGLKQLLSEWPLFKSSGIFGTGASGIDHPLYKKLANMPLVAILAGRYEGATPEIKRSITDYMNGWRYEEGIMQQQGETFEHYLRRVIRRIIDKNKEQ